MYFACLDVTIIYKKKTKIWFAQNLHVQTNCFPLNIFLIKWIDWLWSWYQYTLFYQMCTIYPHPPQWIYLYIFCCFVFVLNATDKIVSEQENLHNLFEINIIYRNMIDISNKFEKLFCKDFLLFIYIYPMNKNLYTNF